MIVENFQSKMIFNREIQVLTEWMVDSFFGAIPSVRKSERKKLITLIVRYTWPKYSIWSE